MKSRLRSRLRAARTRFVPTVLLAALAALAGQPAAAQAESRRGEIAWQPHTAMGVDGVELTGQLGRLRVPEDRSKPDGPTIELAFVVYPSTRPDPGPPIVFLAGGPGGSGVEGCIGPATGRMVRLLEYGDVIGLDQRGTGLSRPNVMEAPGCSYDLPFDHVLTREDVIVEERRGIEQMLAYWKQQGVNPEAYNSVESADDIEDLRQALGAEELVLFGSSYGTHLGLAYLRRHGAHVARAVLSKVEGPNHTIKLPSQIQAQLEKLHELVAADERLSEYMPDFLGAVRALLARLDEEPVEVTLRRGTGEVTVTCGAYDLQRGLCGMLANRTELERVPGLIWRLMTDDWEPLGEIAADLRHGEPFPLMSLMMDCSSGATPERLARIAREARDERNLLSDAMDGFYPVVCEAAGSPDLGDDFRGLLKCDVPVLFVSGDLDARTPPSNVLELRSGFPNSVHVVAVNCGHPARENMSEEYRTLLAKFLRGEQVADTVVSLPPLRFPALE